MVSSGCGDLNEVRFAGGVARSRENGVVMTVPNGANDCGVSGSGKMRTAGGGEISVGAGILNV